MGHSMHDQIWIVRHEDEDARKNCDETGVRILSHSQVVCLQWTMQDVIMHKWYSFHSS